MNRHRGGTATAVAWVKSNSFRVDGVSACATKAVMLVLADYMDENYSCYLGRSSLAEMADVSEHTLGRFLPAAEAAGFLCRHSRMLDGGRGRATDRIYLHVGGRTDLCGCGPPCQDGNEVGTTTLPNEHDHLAKSAQNRGGTPLIPEPANVNPRTIVRSDEPDGFDAFWGIYPRRCAKGAARKAFKSALKKASAESIVGGARQFANDPGRPEEKYIPHPATWLNRESWDDPPLPSLNGNGSRHNGGSRFDALRALAEEDSHGAA